MLELLHHEIQHSGMYGILEKEEYAVFVAAVLPKG
jgi:uncharacterized protein YqgQ